MINLIKMDLRRMLRSTLLKVFLIIVASLNIFAGIIVPVITNTLPSSFSDKMGVQSVKLSSLITDPFSISLLIIMMFMSIVSFSYADFANGYVKNLAGQVKSRSGLIYSKFVVIGIHNCIFLAAGVVSRIIGALIGSAAGATLEADNMIPSALVTLLIKWMLSMGISAILLFVTTGIRSKTFASIIGVIIGTGALGLVYLGLDTALYNIFHINNFSISDYMPDQLILGSNIIVLNAIIVAVVCSVVFLLLTVNTFKKRDIK